MLAAGFRSDNAMYPEAESLDISNLRYALYVRKSTDDSQRQARSIPDQIAECEELARRLGIRILNPIIKETKSAKVPGKRPLFTQLLSDIRKGKYDGILAWHPDRLARNMKEGGELIDMIDEEIIKDLKFVTHHFTPDANGKMLLGMSFVLSKQYSDDLSQKVTRGMRRGFAEGKSSGTPKHGYIRTEHGDYQPDGKNFDLICDAWRMRLEGASIKNIVNHLNDNGYGRLIKGKAAKNYGKIVRMWPQGLSDLFRDPFYYGILVQANQQIDLREIYNFVPAVSEEHYNEVQALSRTRVTRMTKKRGTFYPLKGMVVCGVCHHKMYPAASKGRDRRYLYYRCDNKVCTRKQKSVRAKVVFEYVYGVVSSGLRFTSKDYNLYREKLLSLGDSRKIALETQVRSKRGALNAVEAEIQAISLKLINFSKDSTVYRVNSKKLEELEVRAEELVNEIKVLQTQQTDPAQDALSLEQFLNLSKNASSYLKAANGVAKDAICRILFLNLTISDNNLLSHSWKEPFTSLMQVDEIIDGRGERTRTFDLAVPNRAR